MRGDLVDQVKIDSQNRWAVSISGVNYMGIPQFIKESAGMMEIRVNWDELGQRQFLLQTVTDETN